LEIDTIPPTTSPEPSLHSLLAAIPPEGKAFNPRATAYILDGVIIFGVTYGINFLIGVCLPQALRLIGLVFHIGFTLGQVSYPIQLITGFTLTLLYLALFEWICGASPGKFILRMRVVQEDGSPCRLWPAFLRGFLRLIDGIFFGLPAIMAMKTPTYQRIGDKAAETMVVDQKYVVNPRRLIGLRAVCVVAVYLMLAPVVRIGSLATGIGQVQKLVTGNANRINLQVEDLGSQFYQKNELTKESFPSKTNWDANQRLFSSPDLAVESRLVLLKGYPTDTEKDISLSLRTSLEQIFSDTQLQIEPAVDASVGERGWIVRFTEKQTGKVGYALVFIRKNVYVRLIFYGKPGVIEYHGAEEIGQIIDQRILTGAYPPQEKKFIS
jgi:uncharacterized RDD family membrane protein YckC